MLDIQQRFHRRGGVFTTVVPDYLRADARRLLRFAKRRARCRVTLTVWLHPDPVITTIFWRFEHRGKVHKGTRRVVLRSTDFGVYNHSRATVGRPLSPLVARETQWLYALQYSVGEILDAANAWVSTPKTQRTPIRLTEQGGLPYGVL